MKTKTKTKTKQIIWAIILTLGLILFFATGCRSVQPVIVEKTKIEYRDRLRVDSVYNRDTIQIYKKNDTIYYEKIRWRERFKIDTVSGKAYKINEVVTNGVLTRTLTEV